MKSDGTINKGPGTWMLVLAYFDRRPFRVLLSMIGEVDVHITGLEWDGPKGGHKIKGKILEGDYKDRTFTGTYTTSPARRFCGTYEFNE